MAYKNKELEKLRKKRYREANKEHIREYSKQYQEANKEHLREYSKQYQLQYKKQYTLRTKYGITLQDRDQMLVQQNHTCGNPRCNTKLELDRNTHIDHDHHTGKVRGLLCRRCNLLEGCVAKNPHRFIGILAYQIQHDSLPFNAEELAHVYLETV